MSHLTSNGHITPWTPEIDAAHRELWPTNSSAQITRKLNEQFGTNFSRNAIIGRSHRIKLPRKALPTRKRSPEQILAAIERKLEKKREYMRQYYARNAERVQKQATWRGSPQVIDQQIPLEQRATFWELERQDCRWIVGHPNEPDHFYCGGPAVEGLPFCASHCDRAYLFKR